MPRIRSLVLLGGLLAIVTAWLIASASADRNSEKTLVQLPDSAPSASSARIAPTPAPKLEAASLSHSEPPPIDELRGNQQRQALYDAEAKPGDFVTPPAVSIEH